MPVILLCHFIINIRLGRKKKRHERNNMTDTLLLTFGGGYDGIGA